MEKRGEIYFSSSKKEKYNLDSKELKSFTDKLKSQFGLSLKSSEEAITYERLKLAQLVVFIGPRTRFSDREIEALKKYVDEGGSIFLQVSEQQPNTENMNRLLKTWGMEIKRDSVIRTVYFKYFHPKEVCIENGVVNREINRWAGKPTPGSANLMNSPNSSPAKNGKSYSLTGKSKLDTNIDTKSFGSEHSISGDVVFVYPYGCTLNISPPSFPILSSGYVAYPVNRPICGVFEHHSSEGKVMILGSSEMFVNTWIEKEENAILQYVLFRWLLDKGKKRRERIRGGSSSSKSKNLLRNRMEHGGYKSMMTEGGDGQDEDDKNQVSKLLFNEIDEKQPDITDYYYLPDSEKLSSTMKPCLLEQSSLPKDFTALFDEKRFSFNTKLIPKVIECYEKLGVKHEPLKLIPPAFETPLPPTAPAVYHPILNDPPAPSLDLFDLDEEFASEEIRLTQLTSRCTNEDIEYYTQKCGEIFGVTQRLSSKLRHDPKIILEFVYRQITDFKRRKHGRGELIEEE